MTNSLPPLPEYGPRPDLWSRIEADLLADEQLSRRLPDLPIHEPKATLWEAIEENLHSEAPTTIRPRWAIWTSSLTWSGFAAAAVVILIGGWLAWPAEPAEAVRVEYAVERTETFPARTDDHLLTQSSADRRAEAFIARQCAEQQLACQRPEVHELRNQLASLTAEQQRIEREQQIFGNDPALVRAQVKIENQRAEVTKELITLLRS